ncbi:MAG: HAMP domain-containing histidine kinase [Burkholderiaceae bacterium]|jgi:signal transduction histidine kinase|nr:HAMP domain-containing histidine kinase [Burkholderiaceae bacterium]
MKAPQPQARSRQDTSALYRDAGLSPGLATEAEAWVNQELIVRMMRGMRFLYGPSVLTMCALIALNWGHLPVWAAVIWLCIGAAITLEGLKIETTYLRSIANKDTDTQQGLASRSRYLWIFSGTHWAFIQIFFSHEMTTYQFMSWMILTAVGIFPLNVLALRPVLLRNFTSGLIITTVILAAARLGWMVYTDGLPPFTFTFTAWIIVLEVFNWLMLDSQGRRIYKSARHLHELRFYNNALIDSLTQQRQAALAAVATRSRFLSSAAHDMRQPVLALSMYADYLQNEPQMAQELTPKIVRATHAVNALFDSLFDLGNIDSGKVRLYLERVDIEQLLHDIEQQYRPQAEAKGVRLRVHIKPCSVLSDTVRLRRIISNLLSNAIRYTPPGGAVLLASRQRRDGPCVEVWDTGVGIAPEHQNDIFLEFYKVDDGQIESDGESFGLGLAIVSRLSHVLGHPISLCSRVGHGSMFRVTLSDANEAKVHERSLGLDV